MARATALAVLVLSACSPFAAATDGSDAGDAGDVTADGAADATADGGATADGPSGGPKLVFVTKNEMPGSFSESDAVQFCNTEGRAVKPSAAFVPWVTITHGPMSVLPNDGVWKNKSGDVIFPSRAAIIGGVLGHTIDENADGTNTKASAWTNTSSDGTKASTDPAKNCQSFASTNGGLSGIIGKPAANTDGKWTNDGSLGCDMSAALICFER